MNKNASFLVGDRVVLISPLEMYTDATRATQEFLFRHHGGDIGCGSVYEKISELTA